MKRIILLFISVFSLAAVSCVRTEVPEYSYSGELSLNEQTLEQLRIPVPDESSDEDESEIVPLNHEHQKAMWYTYMNYLNILKGKTEDEFTDSVRDDLKSISELGINTLYLHVRAFGDSYYHSEIFPAGEYYDGEYDPLEIILRESHNLGISVHAWVNPLRCQTEEQLKALDSRYLIKNWYDDSEKNGKYIVKSENRFYLNPAYPEVTELITDGIREITENYSVDGIHIDDYFYPSADENFDSDAFSESGSSSLIEWRRENINNMVKSIYSSVKKQNEALLFGISPQGNINTDMNILCADVEKWSAEPGFCDYIAPQLYYGFKNENCPFTETAQKWKALNTCGDVRLIIGLCTYKIGKKDEWAGIGENEWIENRTLTCGQIKYCMDNNTDFALYSFESTFSADISEERKAMSEIIKQYGGGEGQ